MTPEGRRCRYLIGSRATSAPAAKGAFGIDDSAPTGTGIVYLCNWADTVVPPFLAASPTWLSREVLGGHLFRDGDCRRCPCYEPTGDDVEIIE